jgi:hypothetical protein
VSFADNVGTGDEEVTEAAVTVTGVGTYFGEKTESFSIAAYRDIAVCTANHPTVYDDGYGPYGSLIERLVVMNGDTRLEPFVDYDVDLPYIGLGEYEAGREYEAFVCGCGDWGGQLSVSFTFDEMTFSVVFDPGEGSGTMETDYVRAGAPYTLPACGFTAPRGMVFSRWSLSLDPEQELEPDESFTAPGLRLYDTVLTVTAVWAPDPGPITITQQPADVSVLPGEIASTTVVAEGEGLTYQWYGRETNGREFRSGLKGDTYSVTLVKGKFGRVVWCVITDRDGNTATTREAVLNAAYPEDYFEPSVTISGDSFVDVGGTASVTVEATGYGELTYQWYFRNAGTEKQSRSGIRGDTYSVEMNGSRDGRTVWCVVTDVWGNSAVSEERVIGFDKPAGYEVPTVSVRADNAHTDVDVGELAFVTVDAAGPDGTAEGLTYQWYLRANENAAWSKSSIRGDTYSITMIPSKSGRQVRCVVTDAYGKTARSEVFTLTMVIPEEYAEGPEIITQPTDASAARNKTVRATVAAEGVELSYQWYFRDDENAAWKKSSLTGDTYSVKMIPSKSGRQVKCVVTDKYGRRVTSEIATLTMEP